MLKEIGDKYLLKYCLDPNDECGPIMFDNPDCQDQVQKGDWYLASKGDIFDAVQKRKK